MHLPAPTEVVTTERGALELFVLEGAVIQRVRGYANRAIAEGIVRGVDKALARHARVAQWNDWYLATGYDPEVRPILTEYMRRRHDQIAETHVLVGSRLVAMGLAVAGIVVPGITSYSDIAAFDRALSRGVGPIDLQRPARGSRPPPPSRPRRHGAP